MDLPPPEMQDDFEESDSIMKYLDHPADLQIFCKSPSINKLFVAASKAMINYCTSIQHINEFHLKETRENKTRSCVSDGVIDAKFKSFEYRDSGVGTSGYELALVKYLQNFLEVMYCDEYVPFKFNVDIGSKELYCGFLGCKMEFCRMKGEIKAVTFSKLKVEQKDGFFECYFIVDI